MILWGVWKEGSGSGKQFYHSDYVKYFNAPFSKDNYSSHNKWMHVAKWTKYFYLEAHTKKSFFDIGRICVLHITLYEYAGPNSLPLRTLVDKEIIDIIIGEMIFYTENLYGIT